MKHEILTKHAIPIGIYTYYAFKGPLCIVVKPQIGLMDRYEIWMFPLFENKLGSIATVIEQGFHNRIHVNSEFGNSFKVCRCLMDITSVIEN